MAINPEFYNLVILPSFIFIIALVRQSFETIKTILADKGYRIFATIFAAAEIALALLVLDALITGSTNGSTEPIIVASVLGYAFGTYVGIFVEEKISIGREKITITIPVGRDEKGEIRKEEHYGIRKFLLYLRERKFTYTIRNVKGSRNPGIEIVVVIDRCRQSEIDDGLRLFLRDPKNPRESRAFEYIEDVRIALRGVFPSPLSVVDRFQAVSNKIKGKVFFGKVKITITIPRSNEERYGIAKFLLYLAQRDIAYTNEPKSDSVEIIVIKDRSYLSVIDEGLKLYFPDPDNPRKSRTSEFIEDFLPLKSGSAEPHSIIDRFHSFIAGVKEKIFPDKVKITITIPRSDEERFGIANFLRYLIGSGIDYNRIDGKEPQSASVEIIVVIDRSYLSVIDEGLKLYFPDPNNPKKSRTSEFIEDVRFSLMDIFLSQKKK